MKYCLKFFFLLGENPQTPLLNDYGANLFWSMIFQIGNWYASLVLYSHIDWRLYHFSIVLQNCLKTYGRNIGLLYHSEIFFILEAPAPNPLLRSHWWDFRGISHRPRRLEVLIIVYIPKIGPSKRIVPPIKFKFSYGGPTTPLLGCSTNLCYPSKSGDRPNYVSLT